MATKWTAEQQKAISEYGGNILVSAAAGSGKTAVLIERILNIIKEKTDVDKMLIVTFTNAAAAELRERLYTSLQKELDSPDITPSMAKRLARQQTLLSKSYITTIDSFCKTVVSSNPVESGFDASFRLADEGEIAVVKAEAVDRVLERRYTEGKKEFLRLVDSLGSYKDDERLVEQILDLYRFSQSHPLPTQWLISQKETFNISKIKDFSETLWYKELIKDLYITFEAFYDNLYKLYEKSVVHGISEYEKMLSEDLCVLKSVTDSLKDANVLANSDDVHKRKAWSDVFDVLFGIKFNTAPRMVSKTILVKYGEEVCEIIEFIKKERANIKKKITDAFLQKAGNYPGAPMDDIRAAASDMLELIDVTLEFTEEFNRRKNDKHIMTFDDISHRAFDVLADKNETGKTVKSDVAKRYCKYFEEVYIDEYQDTNELQDAILNLVSRNNAEAVESDKKLVPNMFMVGDVKQSIYGFRQARPDIFTDKYKSYGRQERSGKLIVLNKNFRSRQGVIDSVNSVFKKIMTENTCGIDYNEDEFLNFGAEYYPETSENMNTELYLIKKSSKKDNYEAESVAQIVKNLIDSKFQVFDKETKQMREVTYKDIVILMRSPGKKKGKQYMQCMKNIGIPAFYPESGGFFANAEINILLSFMKTVDNPLQDIHFVATMRNIYGFSDTEIATIKVDSNKRLKENNSGKVESFYEMCKQFSEEGTLKQNINTFLDRLEVLRKRSKHISVSELIWTLMHENHFFEHLICGPMGGLHIANIYLLYAKAIKYDSEVNRGLFRFLYYFDDLKKHKSDMDEANAAAEGMNVVRIMSIHKSKGLEFPVVILADTGKNFNMQDIKAPVLKHRLLGLGPSCYLEQERVKYPSVMKFCVARRLQADNRAEEMRVLYVAMTRAAEKLIITGTINQEPESFLSSMENKCSSVTKEPLPYSILEARNFMSWIAMCKCVDNAHIYTCYDPDDVDDAENIDEYDTERQIAAASVIPQPAMTFYKEEYNISYNKLPAKISVSDLKRLLSESESFDEDNVGSLDINKQIEMSKIPDFENLSVSKPLTPAQVGTAVHICMQLTDYSKLCDITKEKAKEYVEELLLEAQDRGFLRKEQAECIDKELIIKFYMSDTAKKIALSDEVMKEVPFTKLEEIDGETVAVQGIIDCIIREKDKYTVIDFKTDEVADGQKYKAQLAYYAEAVRKVFGGEPEKIVYFIKHDKQEFL